MGERDDARREIQQKRERMSEIAHEVSRRMTPHYAKERAREMAREGMMRARDRAVENSWFGPLLGAGIGALVAKALQARALERDRGWRGEWRGGDWRGGDRSYARGPSSPYRWAGVEDESYLTDAELAERRSMQGAWRGEEAEGERGSVASAASGIAEKATEMKERAQAATEQAREKVQEASSGLRERLQDASSGVRERLPDREAIRASAREDTGIWALGALALGALFGFALPVTDSERQALRPARRKARELGRELEERVLSKGEQALDDARSRVEERGEQDTGMSSGASGSGDEPPPLH